MRVVCSLSDYLFNRGVKKSANHNKNENDSQINVTIATIVCGVMLFDVHSRQLTVTGGFKSYGSFGSAKQC